MKIRRTPRCLFRKFLVVSPVVLWISLFPGRRDPFLSGVPPKILFASPNPAEDVLKDDVDYEALLSSVRRVTLETDLGPLPPDQKEAIRTLLRIAPQIDAVYQKQTSGTQDIAKEIAGRRQTPRTSAALELLRINLGPHNPWDSPPTLFNVPPESVNALFPPGLSQDEFERYLGERPEQKEKLSSPYTVVRRNSDGSLSAEYYHDAFSPEVSAIAGILIEAAQKTRHKGFREFLKAKAKDLLRDDYEDSYGRWVKIKDSPVELAVGPAGGLSKQYFGFGLYLQDERGAQVLEKFADAAREWGRRLPIDPRHNPYLKNARFKRLRHIIPVNMVAGGGSFLVNTPAGLILPDEPHISARHGNKILLIRNVIATRDYDAMNFVQKFLFAEDYNPDAFYWFAAGHELAHGMLPAHKGFDPAGTPLDQDLGSIFSPQEEAKADLLGLLLLEELAKKGELAWKDYWAIARMHAGALTVVRCHRAPSHDPRFFLVAYNLLKAKGAISFDPANHRLTVHPGYPEAVRETAALFLKIQAEGDKALAEKLLERDAAPAPEVRAALDALRDARVPQKTYYMFSIKE